MIDYPLAKRKLSEIFAALNRAQECDGAKFREQLNDWLQRYSIVSTCLTDDELILRAGGKDFDQ